jgi:hypothetical protein
MGAPSSPGFRLDQTFFGFKPQDRVKFHDSLFNMLWYGAGRWDWNTLYTMPVYLRRYWIRRIEKMIAEDAQRKSQQQSMAEARRKRKVVKSPL